MLSKEDLLNNIEALKKRIEADYFGEINAFCIHLACDRGDSEILFGSEEKIYRLCRITQVRLDNNLAKNTITYTIKKGDKNFKV